MTKAIEEVFDYLPSILDNKKVCEFCRDKTRCSECVFRERKVNLKSGKNHRDNV